MNYKDKVWALVDERGEPKRAVVATLKPQAIERLFAFDDAPLSSYVRLVVDGRHKVVECTLTLTAVT